MGAYESAMTVKKLEEEEKTMQLHGTWDDILDAVDTHENGGIMEEEILDVIQLCPAQSPMAKSLKHLLSEDNKMHHIRKAHLETIFVENIRRDPEHNLLMKKLKRETEEKNRGRTEHMRNIQVEIFNVLDFAGDGIITKLEIRNMLRYMAASCEDVLEIMRRDKNKDGTISFDEFMDHFYQSTLRRGAPKTYQIERAQILLERLKLARERMIVGSMRRGKGCRLFSYC
uniref:EF-hand domain-containing protein n=1 Tax=Lotharella globosa TaxID=91324 RepID=A0A7S3YP32_9EUKA